MPSSHEKWNEGGAPHEAASSQRDHKAGKRNGRAARKAWGAQWLDDTTFKVENEGVDLTDDDLVDWVEALDAEIQDYFQGDPPALTMSMLNFSCNRITDYGVMAVVDFLCHHGISVDKVMLHKNLISDDGANAIGELLVKSPRPIQEVHLSHNDISESGFFSLLGAVRDCGRYPYERDSPSGKSKGKKDAGSPLWMRIENNVTNVKALEHFMNNNFHWSTATSHDRFSQSKGAMVCFHKTYFNQKKSLTETAGAADKSKRQQIKAPTEPVRAADDRTVENVALEGAPSRKKEPSQKDAKLDMSYLEAAAPKSEEHGQLHKHTEAIQAKIDAQKRRAARSGINNTLDPAISLLPVPLPPPLTMVPGRVPSADPSDSTTAASSENVTPLGDSDFTPGVFLSKKSRKQRSVEDRNCWQQRADARLSSIAGQEAYTRQDFDTVKVLQRPRDTEEADEPDEQSPDTSSDKIVGELAAALLHQQLSGGVQEPDNPSLQLAMRSVQDLPCFGDLDLKARWYQHLKSAEHPELEANRLANLCRSLQGTGYNGGGNGEDGLANNVEGSTLFTQPPISAALSVGPQSSLQTNGDSMNSSSSVADFTADEKTIPEIDKFGDIAVKKKKHGSNKLSK